VEIKRWFRFFFFKGGTWNHATVLVILFGDKWSSSCERFIYQVFTRPVFLAIPKSRRIKNRFSFSGSTNLHPPNRIRGSAVLSTTSLPTATTSYRWLKPRLSLGTRWLDESFSDNCVTTLMLIPRSVNYFLTFFDEGGYSNGFSVLFRWLSSRWSTLTVPVTTIRRIIDGWFTWSPPGKTFSTGLQDALVRGEFWIRTG